MNTHTYTNTIKPQTVNLAAMKWTARHFTDCVLRPWLVQSIFSLVPASSFVPFPFFIMFWQVRLFMQRDPTKIWECHLCLLIQDRATTLPFLLATKQAKHTLCQHPSTKRDDEWRGHNCFACREGICVRSIGHLPFLLGISSPPKPLCVSVLKCFGLQPAQTCHGERKSDCICTCNWFKRRLCLILIYIKQLYYYIIAKGI